MTCWNSFSLPCCFFLAPSSLAPVSIFDVYYSSCLSVLWEQCKCYTMYTFKLCEMCVPHISLRTRKYIFILTGKLGFKLYIVLLLLQVKWIVIPTVTTMAMGVVVKVGESEKRWWDDNLCCNVNGYICIISTSVFECVFTVGDAVCMCGGVSSCMYECECACVFGHLCILACILPEDSVYTNVSCTNKTISKYDIRIRYMLVN